jgi:hypothetical protein
MPHTVPRTGGMSTFGFSRILCTNSSAKNSALVRCCFADLSGTTHVFVFSLAQHFFIDAPGEGNDTYDITNDTTGELHDVARRHIPAYVNEICSSVDTATVHARLDCEGALHYLLGHAGRDDTSFRLRADGTTEIEVFVDYGPQYENVRLRKGFTRLPIDQATARLKDLKRDEHEYLEEIESYSISDVSSCIEYFRNVIASATWKDLGDEFVLRTLAVLILLKSRARLVEAEMDDLADDEDFCDNGYTELAIPELVAAADKLVHRLFIQWGNDGELQQRLVSRDVFACSLKKVLKKRDTADLKTLTPEDFRHLIDSI